MEINLKPGKYIVAVSGGVDSVVLLDLCAKQPKLDLVVAHFDHGIRRDSNDDCDFVGNLAEKYGYKFFSEKGKLGAKASEATARQARYDFLKKIKDSQKAKYILTAHHQDDELETIAINVLRGTGRKGVSPLKSREGLMRPMLDFSKEQIISYATSHQLRWREDNTNKDEKYLRNFLRRSVLPKLTIAQNKKLIEISKKTDVTNKQIDKMLQSYIKDDCINTKFFNSLSHNVACECLAYFLRNQRISFDKKTINKLVISLKTLKPGTSLDIDKKWKIILEKNSIRLIEPKSV